MRQYSVVLWDLDGTIVDSAEGIYVSFEHTFTEMNWEVPDRATLRKFLGPPLVETFGELNPIDEGCLSVPGLWHPTPRYEKVVVRGQLLDGSTISIAAEGLLAQAMQHECDHLDGNVYLDRLEIDERRNAMKKLRETDWFLNG
jgi:peptide deformylase